MQAAELFVGLDVGGTKTAALLVDSDNCVQGQAVVPTQTANPAALLDTIAEAVQTVLVEAQAAPTQLQSIGLGVPGQVDPSTGVVQLAVNLNLQAYPLGTTLSKRLQRPVLLENDVRVAALGAYARWRQTETGQSLAYLNVGTGIAAGVILNGRLHRGHNGMAGEVGHMIVEPDGVLCKCGLRGCLETIAAGPAIVRQMTLAEPQTPSQTAGDVYEAARQGNKAAQVIVQRVSQYLSRTVQWLIMSYDVEKILFGGGVTRSGAAFFAPILHELDQLRRQSALAAQLLGDEKFALMPPDDNPGLWGAVHLARQAKDSQSI